jgi:phosphoglycerate dehydrogenase-like enzyme
LPSDHPLWSAPNLVLTPHIGGSSTAGWLPRAFELVGQQIGRLQRGEALHNIVDGDY